MSACLPRKPKDVNEPQRTHRRGSDALPRPADPAVLLGDVAQNVLRVPLLHLAEHVVHLRFAYIKVWVRAKVIVALTRVRDESHDIISYHIQVEDHARLGKIEGTR